MRRGRGRARRPAGQVWTLRRVPNRIARGLVAAAAVAVLCFAFHLTGWGLLPGRLTGDVLLAALAAGMPVALAVAFLLAAPLLRLVARPAPLGPRPVIRLGAAVYGLLAFLWMAALAPGPPEAVRAALGLGSCAGPACEAAVLLYRHALTPLAFALYGGLAAGAGWLAAFGARGRVDLAPLLP